MTVFFKINTLVNCVYKFRLFYTELSFLKSDEHLFYFQIRKLVCNLENITLDSYFLNFQIAENVL